MQRCVDDLDDRLYKTCPLPVPQGSLANVVRIAFHSSSGSNYANLCTGTYARDTLHNHYNDAPFAQISQKNLAARDFLSSSFQTT